MTDDELKAIERRIAATTPGKWIRTGAYIYPSDAPETCVIDCLSQRGAYSCQANAEFVCNSREDLTLLIAEVRNLRATLEQIHELSGNPTTTDVRPSA